MFEIVLIFVCSPTYWCDISDIGYTQEIDTAGRIGRLASAINNILLE